MISPVLSGTRVSLPSGVNSSAISGSVNRNVRRQIGTPLSDWSNCENARQNKGRAASFIYTDL